MATKPYAASANYVNRMTTYCGQCPYDQGARTGDDACPFNALSFNALYWDFVERHRARLSGNRRLRPLLSTLDRFGADERRAITERPGGSAPMCMKVRDSTVGQPGIVGCGGATLV